MPSVLAPSSDPNDWPSLHDQLALAIDLYGADGGTRVADWLHVQTERIANADFARLFSDHIDLPGIASLDYAHRLIRSKRGSLIGGIRFYGHDIERPFVEIVAHDFGQGPHDLAALADTVRTEWSAFAPPHARLRAMPNAALSSGSHIDTHVFVARYSEMAPPDGRVRLDPLADPDEGMAMVESRFASMERDAPALRRNVSPIERDYLRELQEQGRAHSIVPTVGYDRGTAGLLAVAPGAVDWIEGDEVMEEVVALTHAGQGYAASAQRALAAHERSRKDELLIGTIDALNHASRRTAERAGRQHVMDYAFVPLGRVP